MNAQAHRHTESISQEPLSVSDFIEIMLDDIVEETQKTYHCDAQRILDVIITTAWNKRKQLSGSTSVAIGKNQTSAGGVMAGSGHPRTASSANPSPAHSYGNGTARMPHRTTNGARAASAMHTASFLQTYMLRGKVLGDITMSELVIMEGETEVELRLIKMLRNHAANVAGYDTVSDVLNDETAMEYVKRAISGEADE